MGTILVFLADGFEEIEGLTVADVLRRAGLKVQTVSIMGRAQVTGAHGIPVIADTVLEEADFEEAELLVLPGGMPGTRYLGECGALTKRLLEFHAAGRKLAAICAAPSVLGDLGILEGRKAVCYPGFEERLRGADVGKEAVALDGNVMTSRGPGTALPFALALVSWLKSDEESARIRESMIFG